jgi:hypothetical protein
VATLAFAFVVQAGVRAAELEEAASKATTISAAHDDLGRIVEARGEARLRRCGPVVVDAIEGQTAVAWKLDLPIDAVEVSRDVPARGIYLERIGDGWRLQKLGCPNFS